MEDEGEKKIIVYYSLPFLYKNSLNCYFAIIYFPNVSFIHLKKTMIINEFLEKYNEIIIHNCHDDNLKIGFEIPKTTLDLDDRLKYLFRIIEKYMSPYQIILKKKFLLIYPWICYMNEFKKQWSHTFYTVWLTFFLLCFLTLYLKCEWIYLTIFIFMTYLLLFLKTIKLMSIG